MFLAVLLMASMTACSNVKGNRKTEASQSQESESAEHRQQDTSVFIAYTPEEEVAFAAEHRSFRIVYRSF